MSLDELEIEEEEDDDWRDASQITPVCSPSTKRKSSTTIDVMIRSPQTERTAFEEQISDTPPRVSPDGEGDNVETVRPRVKLKLASSSSSTVDEPPRFSIQEKRKTFVRHSSLDFDTTRSTSLAENLSLRLFDASELEILVTAFIVLTDWVLERPTTKRKEKTKTLPWRGIIFENETAIVEERVRRGSASRGLRNI